MKIIWITTQFPSNESDTKGRFIYRTVRELANEHDITVINLHSVLPPIIPMIKDLKNAKSIFKVWRQKYPPNPKPPIDMQNKVIYTNFVRLPRGMFHHIEGWFGYLSVKRSVKELLSQDSIVHATWLFPEGDLANILYKKYKIPFVVTLMGSDVHYLQKGSKKWTKAKEIINNASFVTSVSKQLYSDLESKSILVPNEKRQLTHTIYEFEKFKILDKIKIRAALKISDNDKIIFFAGALRDIKNVDILISSLHHLLSEDKLFEKDLKLIIAGKGENEGKLKSQMEKLGLNDNVSFLGGLNGEDMIKYYNSADVFCLPSKNEGLPNVIVEALLCGTPVVASSVGEIPFVIQEELNGYLVPPSDSILLAERLKKSLLKDWNRGKLRESVDFLKKENVLNEYSQIYSKLKIS